MTDVSSQTQKATLFLSYHHQKKLLLLPNAWDVASALIYEGLGYKALATTSAGVAASLGYTDGESIPFDRLTYVVSRMVESVDIPVSVDLESGFSDTIEGVVDNVRELILQGVVGINLEDSPKGAPHPTTLLDIEEQSAKIAAIKQMAHAQGIPLVINARTDVFWLGLYDEKARMERTLHRANAYSKAGADSIFVPGLTDIEHVQLLVEHLSMPLNACCEILTKLPDQQRPGADAPGAD